MKHSYLYIILSLCLTAAFFLGGCAQDLQTPDTAENDVEILSETAVPSAVPTVSPSPAPAESETRDFPDALPKPGGNAFESEEAKRLLYEMAEPLYQDEFSFLENVSYFENGFSYTYADIGSQYPVMLATGETFTYDITEQIQACISIMRMAATRNTVLQTYRKNSFYATIMQPNFFRIFAVKPAMVKLSLYIF